jgi:transposase InsO family protein
LIQASDRLRAIELIEEAIHAGARSRPACNVMCISMRTFERWKKPLGQQDKRKMADRLVVNKLTLEEKHEVLSIANSARFQDLPPCKIVPMLADEKKYIASESTFYRILKEENQLAHRGKSRPAKHNRPKECVAAAPCQVWSWDISYLPNQVTGLYFYLYMIIDIFSRKIVGFRVHEEESAEHASRLMEQACIDENIAPNQLTLHQDNGSPMKASIFHATLKKLGVVPSFSRPSVSDDNPYSEALFKTMKYRPEFPACKRFESLEDATKWCEWFVNWYNNQHLHSELNFLPPAYRHTGKDKDVLANRHDIYLAAKEKNPLRWSGRKTRNWSLPHTVSLNPNKKINSHIEKTESSCMIAA